MRLRRYSRSSFEHRTQTQEAELHRCDASGSSLINCQVNVLEGVTGLADRHHIGTGSNESSGHLRSDAPRVGDGRARSCSSLGLPLSTPPALLKTSSGATSGVSVSTTSGACEQLLAELVGPCPPGGASC